MEVAGLQSTVAVAGGLIGTDGMGSALAFVDGFSWEVLGGVARFGFLDSVPFAVDEASSQVKLFDRWPEVETLEFPSPTRGGS